MHAVLLAVLFRTAAAEGAIRLVMRTQRVAGLSIAVAHEGRLLYSRGFGYADLSRRTPADSNTVYRIGSLTKSFTAACVIRLEQQGKLSAGDAIGRYVDVPWTATITIDDLLAQRSGIPSYSDVPALSRSEAYAPAQLIAAIASQPLLFQPGTQYAYSNTNYVLLGMAVERVTGTPYGEYVQSQILDPLGLTHTRYGDQPREARGYARDTLNAPVARSSTAYAYAAAGMTSNALDLVRWLQSVPNPYYGFSPAQLYGYDVYFASGTVDGYSSFALIDPRTSDQLAILTNADALDLAPLAMDVFAALEPPRPGTRAPTPRTGVRARRNSPAPARNVRQ